jgi:microcystin-dependent protein
MGEASGGAASGGTTSARAGADLVRPAAPGYLTLNFMIALLGTFPPRS